MNTKIILVLLAVLFTILPIQNQAQQNDWQTLYEKSGFLETPNYEQTIEFCQRLASHSPLVHYTTFGVSPQGRDCRC
jgi:hypothetical protein